MVWIFSSGIALSFGQDPEEPENPMQFYISEVGFGPNGYVELDSKFINDGQFDGTQSVIDHDYLSQFDMSNYKMVLAVRDKSKNKNYSPKVKIKSVIDLKKMKMTRDNFLLITTKNVGNFASSASNTLNEQTNVKLNAYSNPGINLDNLLDMKDTQVMLVLLIYGDVPQNLYMKSLDEDLLKSLKSVLVDGLIFGGRNSRKPEKVLKQLSTSGRRMKIRKEIGNQYSFSRCSIRYAPFSSDAFRDTEPSPGFENRCGDCLGVNIRSNEEMFAELERLEKMIVDDMDQSHSLVNEIDVYMVPVDNETSQVQGCDPMEDVPQNEGELDLFLRREYGRKNKLMTPYRNPLTDPLSDHAYTSFPWEADHLSFADIQMMENFQSDLLPVDRIRKEHKWVEYIKNDTDPRNSHIRCGICKKFSKLANIRGKEMDQISHDAGVLFPQKYHNYLGNSNHIHFAHSNVNTALKINYAWAVSQV